MQANLQPKELTGFYQILPFQLTQYNSTSQPLLQQNVKLSRHVADFSQDQPISL